MPIAIDSRNRQELHDWYENNHKTESEFWVLIKRGKVCSGDTMPYLDALEESICFGWIDSTILQADDGLCLERFSPRRKGSLWTELNKARAERLISLGMMTESGMAANSTAVCN